jgi:ribonuclease R/exosome complex exonuclease DIS3/RRP44
MLPENLSNGLCSLRPNEDKLCFSVVFKIDHNGHVLDEWFGRTVIHSSCRMSYEEAQLIIEKSDGTRENRLHIEENLKEYIDGSKQLYVPLAKEIEVAILALDKIAKKMRKTRLQKGSISFDKHEVKFKLDENNKPVDIIFKVGKDSNKLIEEYMLLANRHVAQYVNSREYPMVNRAHEKPNEEKLEQLKDFLVQFGYDIKINTPEETTKTLNKLLLDVRGTAEEEMISNLVVRTMQKANYMTKNIGHYGLGFKNYAHFTSPIRRYPDVIVHRLLGMYLDGTSKTLPNIAKLDAKCGHLSEREKKAQKAERDSIKYMQCIYMSENIGKVYKGMVTSVTDYGLFVTIEENGCDGLVRLSEIGGDTYVADTENYRVKGYNTGDIIRLGDEVMVVVKSVDIEKKNINLTLLRL